MGLHFLSREHLENSIIEQWILSFCVRLHISVFVPNTHAGFEVSMIFWGAEQKEVVLHKHASAFIMVEGALLLFLHIL